VGRHTSPQLGGRSATRGARFRHATRNISIVTLSPLAIQNGTGIMKSTPHQVCDPGGRFQKKSQLGPVRRANGKQGTPPKFTVLHSIECNFIFLILLRNRCA
jgi:hypothetical protein